ncbi:MAG: Serine/threonine protein kinase [Anaerolineales bacterium]|nr:Serine/threonine protein kinase [Anaerolineales bacterium]
MSDLAGATLGRYQVVGRLGRGGMADVYKGFQPSLDRYVAIKVLHPSMVEEAEFVQRFQREAKSVARLRHPNIIQVFDYDNQGDTYYMVMEFLDGPTLKAALEEVHRRKEEMPLQVALRIVSDVGAALAYAHEVGVVHRDVKPANIMLDRSGRVILTDFGVAKMLTGTKVTVTGTVLGTPAYMSPEQGMGEPGDSRSDIYSLGVVLYELATGRLPYDADTPLAVLLKHVHDPLPLPRTLNPGLPEEIERVILRSLTKDPADRYQTVQAMLDDIAGLPPATVPAARPGALNTRSLAARAPQSAAAAPSPPAPPPSRTTGSLPRKSFWLGGGAVVGVFACLGLLAAGALLIYFTGDDLMKFVAPGPLTATSPPPTVISTTVPRAPTRTPRPPATPLGPAGEILFEDHFDDTGSGWGRLHSNLSSADYQDGVYRIRFDGTNDDAWATSGHAFDDVRIAVGTLKVGGPDDNDFGVICRYRDDANFYALLITSDGYYGVMKMKDGERIMVGQQEGNYLESTAIHQGAAANEIVAECINDHLALHVNGVLVADVRDGAFASGDVGLIAGTFEEGGVEIHFDDFFVYGS